MSNHNFEIGDVVTMKAPFNTVFEGTVADIYKQGIKVNFVCGDKVYIPDHMLYTLTNLTKQQKSKEQQMKEQNVQPKNIQPEDEVTITMTYRDLAKMYALLGSVSCTYNDHRLFYRLEKMLDQSGDIRDSVIVNNIPYENRLKYEEYQKEFEALLFPQGPAETEQQKQIRELREQAEALQEQSKKLLQKAKDIEANQK